MGRIALVCWFEGSAILPAPRKSCFNETSISLCSNTCAHHCFVNLFLGIPHPRIANERNTNLQIGRGNIPNSPLQTTNFIERSAKCRKTNYQTNGVCPHARTGDFTPAPPSERSQRKRACNSPNDDPQQMGHDIQIPKTQKSKKTIEFKMPRGSDELDLF